jgi:hypothetical protein
MVGQQLRDLTVRPLFGGWQKTSSATICPISMTRSPCNITHVFLENSNESESEASFYIYDAEEGECPFLCTPSPEARRYSQTG